MGEVIVVCFIYGLWIGMRELRDWTPREGGDNMGFVYFWDGWF